MSHGKRPIKYPMGHCEQGQFRTVCDVHRELHRFTTDNFKPLSEIKAAEALTLIEEAYDLAKRMAKRLETYNKRSGHEFVRDAYEHE